MGGTLARERRDGFGVVGDRCQSNGFRPKDSVSSMNQIESPNYILTDH